MMTRYAIDVGKILELLRLNKDDFFTVVLEFVKSKGFSNYEETARKLLENARQRVKHLVSKYFVNNTNELINTISQAIIAFMIAIEPAPTQNTGDNDEHADKTVDDDYIPNVWPAIRVLRRENKKIDEAVKALEDGKVEEGVRKLRETGLESDQIIYIVATVLRKPVEEVVDLVYEVL